MKKRSTILFTLFCCALFALPAVAEEAPEASAEEGTIVFYRSRSSKGAAIRLNITGGNDGVVGLLSNASKIIKTLPPGEYTFVITGPSVAGSDSLTLNVEAGKTYYVKGRALLGWPAGRARFTLMDEEEGKAEADKID